MRPTGTVSFLFTDIVGSTRLWEERPDVMPEVLGVHDELVRSAIEAHGGFVFSTGGDGFAAAFQRSVDAVEAGLQAQREMRSCSWAGGVELLVRIGIDTGETVERDDDYFGSPVNRAARVMASAPGGRVVLSEATAAVLDQSSRARLVDLGLRPLRGFREPTRLFGVVDGDEAPWPVATFAATLGNVPRPTTDWVGPITELRRRAAELPRRRIVTLTGPGGVGKTRTAIEIATLLADEFSGGTWFLDLSPLGDGASVVASLATVFGVAPQPGLDLFEATLAWLADRQLLLILDNCEHLVDEAASLVRGMSAVCSRLTILTTSREPLGVDGERVVPLRSLDRDSSVELFCERARAADDTFRLGDAEGHVVGQIVDRLDGIPLAIELAAARIRVLSPADLLARLNDRFKVLRGSGHGGIERHQTLRAAVNWSYQLLSENERVLFDRLSVFPATFEANAVAALAEGIGLDDLDALEALSGLVDKSMVMSIRSTGGTRFRLLETLRQFGEERLADAVQTSEARNDHTSHFLAATERAAELYYTSEQLAVDAILHDEWDNIRAAIQWCLATERLDDALRLTYGVGPHASYRGKAEVRLFYTAIVDRSGDHVDARALYGFAIWDAGLGDVVRAEHTLRQIIGQESEESHHSIAARARLAHLCLTTGRGDEAASLAAGLRDVLGDLPPFRRFDAMSWLWPIGSVADRIAKLRLLDDLLYEMGSPPLFEPVKCGMHGYFELFRTAGRDSLDDCVGWFERAIDQATLYGLTTTELAGRYGLALAVARRCDADASERIAMALDRYREVGMFINLDIAIDATALVLADKGLADPAAVVLGYLERFHVRPTNHPLALLRSNLVERVGPIASPSCQRGFAMNRTELVDFALAQLRLAV